jgi:hypothetical protein
MSKVKMIQTLSAQLLIPCCRLQNNRMIANKSYNIFLVYWSNGTNFLDDASRVETIDRCLPLFLLSSEIKMLVITTLILINYVLLETRVMQLIMILWSKLLTHFPVEHTSALDRAVVENHLVEVPSTGRSNHLGGRSNRLGQERHRKPKTADPGGTSSGTTRLALF